MVESTLMKSLLEAGVHGLLGGLADMAEEGAPDRVLGDFLVVERAASLAENFDGGFVECHGIRMPSRMQQSRWRTNALPVRWRRVGARRVAGAIAPCTGDLKASENLARVGAL